MGAGAMMMPFTSFGNAVGVNRPGDGEPSAHIHIATAVHRNSRHSVIFAPGVTEFKLTQIVGSMRTG